MNPGTENIFVIPFFLKPEKEPQIQVRADVKWEEDSTRLDGKKSYILGVLDMKNSISEIEKRGGTSNLIQNTYI